MFNLNGYKLWGDKRFCNDCVSACWSRPVRKTVHFTRHWLMIPRLGELVCWFQPFTASWLTAEERDLIAQCCCASVLSIKLNTWWGQCSSSKVFLFDSAHGSPLWARELKTNQHSAALLIGGIEGLTARIHWVTQKPDIFWWVTHVNMSQCKESGFCQERQPLRRCGLILKQTKPSYVSVSGKDAGRPSK